jgi:hypothetical protein
MYFLLKYPVSSYPYHSSTCFAAQSLKSKIATALRLSPASKAFTILGVGILKLKPDVNKVPV